MVCMVMVGTFHRYLLLLQYVFGRGQIDHAQLVVLEFLRWARDIPELVQIPGSRNVVFPERGSKP